MLQSDRSRTITAVVTPQAAQHQEPQRQDSARQDPVCLVVGSRNPVKLRAAETGFGRLFPACTCQVRGIAVASGVADQPRSDQQTRRGAEQRAVAARERLAQANFWLGIEGGIAADGAQLCAFAWIAVLDAHGQRGMSRSATFTLPPAIASLVRQGYELGEADDRVFATAGSKRRGGAVGLLSGGAIDRCELYAHAICLAFIPWRNRSLYDLAGGR